MQYNNISLTLPLLFIITHQNVLYLSPVLVYQQLLLFTILLVLQFLQKEKASNINYCNKISNYYGLI